VPSLQVYVFMCCKGSRSVDVILPLEADAGGASLAVCLCLYGVEGIRLCLSPSNPL